MDKPKLDEGNLAIEKLKSPHAKLLQSFSCGRKDEDLFLKKDALAHQKLNLSETFLLFEKGKKEIISYTTLSIGQFKLSPHREFYGIKIEDKPYHLPNNMPCLRIGKLATNQTEKGRGAAGYLVSFAIKYAIEKSKIMPFPFLSLDAYPDVVPYYEKLGFEIAFTPKKEAETICMYLTLYKAPKRKA